jgi:hypothetical protein
MTSILREVDEVRRLELHHTREPPLPGHACFDERDIAPACSRMISTSRASLN